MSFADSSSNIRLGDHTLYASVQNGDGDWGDCELNLNTILGNHDGEFAPGGENFFDSAQGIWLDGTTLRGQLMNVEGEWKDAEIDLNGFIGNDNGSLIFGELSETYLLRILMQMPGLRSQLPEQSACRNELITPDYS